MAESTRSVRVLTRAVTSRRSPRIASTRVISVFARATSGAIWRCSISRTVRIVWPYSRYAITPSPISRIASRTLTAAMMPSSRFVVSRFPAFISGAPSVRRRFEFVPDAHAVVGHFPELLDRFLEPPEFTTQIVDRRLEAFTHVLTCIGIEEVGGGRANNSTDDCSCEYDTRLVHTLLLQWPNGIWLPKQVPRLPCGGIRQLKLPAIKKQRQRHTVPTFLVGAVQRFFT